MRILCRIWPPLDLARTQLWFNRANAGASGTGRKTSSDCIFPASDACAGNRGSQQSGSRSKSSHHFGNARFTVLTPELIRMEWAADGKLKITLRLCF